MGILQWVIWFYVMWLRRMGTTSTEEVDGLSFERGRFLWRDKLVVDHDLDHGSRAGPGSLKASDRYEMWRLYDSISRLQLVVAAGYPVGVLIVWLMRSAR